MLKEGKVDLVRQKSITTKSTKSKSSQTNAAPKSKKPEQELACSHSNKINSNNTTQQNFLDANNPKSPKIEIKENVTTTSSPNITKIASTKNNENEIEIKQTNKKLSTNGIEESNTILPNENTQIRSHQDQNSTNENNKKNQTENILDKLKAMFKF